MILCLIIAILTIIGMIWCVVTNAQNKKIHLPYYWVVTIVGAALMLLFSLAPIDKVIERFTSNDSVNPLKILVLFISMTSISVLLDEAGFLAYLAGKMLLHAGKSQIKLFILLYVTVSLLTVVTSNDIVILTFTPFICYFCKRANIDPLPYLFEEFVAANTFSMTLMIGNPTNIYLASTLGITFGEYFVAMALPALFGGIAAFFAIYLIFRKKLKEEISPQLFKAEMNKPLAYVSLSFLIVCTLLLAVSEFIGLEMWIITLISAVILFFTAFIMQAVRKKGFYELKITAKRLPYSIIPFMLSMFVIVVALEESGFTALLARALESDAPVWVYGTATTLFCNVINNIPMSVLFGSILNGSTNIMAAYASIIGSNIGAFLTPIGALAGIMWSNILKGQNVDMTFLKFCKYGFPIAIPTLAASLAGLLISGLFI